MPIKHIKIQIEHIDIGWEIIFVVNPRQEFYE